MAFGNQTFIQGRVGIGVEILKYNVTYDEISADAGTAVEDLFTLPIGWGIIAAGHHINTNFNGGATSDLTVQVGVTGGDTDQWYAAVSIHEDGTEVPDKFAITATAGIESTSASTLVSALFTASGANTSALTAGDVDLYFVVAPLDLITATTKGA